MSNRIEPASPRVKSGVCIVLFAYGVAPQIDLQACERRMMAATHRQKITRKGRALEYFEYRPAPLVVSLGTEPVSIAGYESRPFVEAVIYDFGAVTVSYAIPLAGSLAEMVELSGEIYDSAELRAAAATVLDSLLEVLRGSAPSLAIAEVVEDYAIFHVEEFEGPIVPAELYTRHAHTLAQILRAEAESLSEQESGEALALRVAFGKSDLAIVDWNAAFLYGREVDDLRTVIEFANVQLLELRYLDRQLDAALEESYAIISQREGAWRSSLRSYRRDVRRIAGLQVDGAILFERVSNALKVFGEEYLSRIYGLTARRLQLSAWDASALRKLATIESIYEKLADEAAMRRLEVLEWIIVLLIAVSIILPFVT